MLYQYCASNYIQYINNKQIGASEQYRSNSWLETYIHDKKKKQKTSKVKTTENSNNNKHQQPKSNNIITFMFFLKSRTQVLVYL